MIQFITYESTRVSQTARSVAAMARHLAIESGVRRAASDEITINTTRKSAFVIGRHHSALNTWVRSIVWACL